MLVRLVALSFALSLTGSVQGAKYAGEAFSLGVGARSLALGGATIAGPFDATAPYWNPAGMGELDGRYLLAMHAETFGSLLNHDYFSYVSANPSDSDRVVAFGAYIYYLGGGGIKFTELNQFNRPEVIREESHSDWLFSTSLAARWGDKMNLGASAKIIYRDLGAESGIGLTLDVGGLYKLNRHLAAGVMVTDITSGFIRYSGGTEFVNTNGDTVETAAESESILPTIKPGLLLTDKYKDFTVSLMGSGDVKFEGRKAAAQFWTGELSLDTHFGLEIGYRNLVFGRTGFDIGRFTTGGGLAVKNFTVDFAYLHHDDLDETFRISAGYRF